MVRDCAVGVRVRDAHAYARVCLECIYSQLHVLRRVLQAPGEWTVSGRLNEKEEYTLLASTKSAVLASAG